MNRLVRSALLLLGLATVTTSGFAASPSGMIDIGTFKAADGCQFVEVHLPTPLLKLGALFVGHDDPKAAELLRSVKEVRVNVVGYNDTNRSDTLGRVNSIRDQLNAGGWNQIVTVRDAKDPQDVAVFVKTGADDVIEGVVVTVIDSNQHQAVVVNVAGNMKPEQLAALGADLHIQPLSQLKLKLAAAHTES